MNIRTRFAAIAVVALASGLALSACSSSGTPASTPAASSSADASLKAMLPDDIQKSGTLVVATDANYPPCDFTTSDGKIDGYNHDFLQAIAAKLGITITQTQVSFDGLIPGVQGGKFQAAMECISDNATREKQVTFIDNAYATSGVLTLSANPAKITESPLSLCGVKVAIQTGTDFVDDYKRYDANCESNGKSKLETTQFPDAPTVYTALQSGRAEAAFTDITTGAYLKKTTGKYEVFASPMMAKVYNGIVVAKDSTKLADALTAALNARIADGSYADVLAKWDLPSLALPKAGINLADSDPLPAPTNCGACGK